MTKVAVFLLNVLVVSMAVAQDKSWLASFPVGMAWTTVTKEVPSGKQLFHFSTEVVEVKDNTVRTRYWRGNLADRPADLIQGRTGVRTLIIDPSSGMHGIAAYQAGMDFLPFEPRGCSPAKPGVDCGLPIRGMKVQSQGMPSWTSSTFTEAKYADRMESLVLEPTGEKLEVLRFTLKARTNAGSPYERVLFYTSAFPYPVQLENRYFGGRPDTIEYVIDRRLK